MEKYRLVAEHKAEDDSHDFPSSEPGNEQMDAPEVRITQQGKPRNYISYALSLFTEGSQTIVLKAMGRAINKAVTIAEILKRKLSLHQINSLSSIEMVDVYAPLEEGLDPVSNRRYVSCMRITLSMKPLDINHCGYQPPLSVDEMTLGDHAQQRYSHNLGEGSSPHHHHHSSHSQQYAVLPSA